MIALLQRVAAASVEIEGARVASIEAGLLVFVGVLRADTEVAAHRLAARVLGYRVFSDTGGRMNLDVRAAGGALLLVPQFTLAANTKKGTRPSFSPAAPPEEGRRLFECFAREVRALYPSVVTGIFGAHMRVALINDGPVTFWLSD